MEASVETSINIWSQLNNRFALGTTFQVDRIRVTWIPATWLIWTRLNILLERKLIAFPFTNYSLVFFLRFEIRFARSRRVWSFGLISTVARVGQTKIKWKSIKGNSLSLSPGRREKSVDISNLLDTRYL